MTKPGHEAPNLDNSDPADMSSRAAEDQLRLGDSPEEPAEEVAETAPGLKLSDEEDARVELLEDTGGLDRGTAIRRTVSKDRAQRDLSHNQASVLGHKIGAQIEARETEEAAQRAEREDKERETVLQVLKETSPDEVKDVDPQTRLAARRIVEGVERRIDEEDQGPPQPPKGQKPVE